MNKNAEKMMIHPKVPGVYINGMTETRGKYKAAHAFPVLRHSICTVMLRAVGKGIMEMYELTLDFALPHFTEAIWPSRRVVILNG